MTEARPRLKKRERRDRILLELRLTPHLRISELAERFGVSTETVRRDVEALSKDGLIGRAHGGATAALSYPGFDERNRARVDERERIGRRAADLVQNGETLMIDSGSTTLQLARFLAFDAKACTVVTNSLQVAMALGHGPAEVFLCPGEYLNSEAAVVGVDTIAYLQNFRVDRCMIGASGFSADGLSETVRGFAEVKRTMLHQSREAHLLIDGEKFGRDGFARVGELSEVSSVVVDNAPDGALGAALAAANVDVHVAA